MHRTDHFIRIAGQKRHIWPILPWPPDASKREQWIVLLMKPEPHFRLPLGHRIRLGGPFAKARHRDKAPPVGIVERRKPERTVEVADIGHRPPLRRRRAGKAPGHGLKLEPAALAPPKHRRRTPRINFPERWKIVAVTLERSEQAPHFVDGRGHRVEIAHPSAPAAHRRARLVVNTGN